MKCYRKGASFESVKDKIENSDIIGLTSNYTRSSAIVIDFIRYVKRVNSKAKVIVGGSDATPRYDYYLRNGCDIVILGEGERVGYRVVREISKGKPLDDISGIAYKIDGNIKHHPRNPLQDTVDVDEIPLPAFDLVDLEKYVEAFEGPLPESVRTPLGMLETSRGCVNNCSFCTTPLLRNSYRCMSIERIRELLKHYKKHHIETIILIEDNILSRLTLEDEYRDGREETIEMFNLLRGYGFAWEFGNGIEFGKFIRNHGIDYELIDSMFYHDIKDGKWVGAFRAYIPLESLHKEPHKVYKKLRPYDETKEIIRAIASKRIPMMTFGILIFDETEESLKLTENRYLEIKDIVESHGTRTLFTPFFHTLLPGSSDFEEHCNRLKYSIEDNPELFQLHTSVIKGKKFEPEDITILKREMEERVNGKQAAEFWSVTGRYYTKGFQYKF